MNKNVLFSFFPDRKKMAEETSFSSSTFSKIRLSAMALMLFSALVLTANASPKLNFMGGLGNHLHKVALVVSPGNKKQPGAPNKLNGKQIELAKGKGFARHNPKKESAVVPSFSYTTPNTFVTVKTIAPLVPAGGSASNPSYNNVVEALTNGNNGSAGLTSGPTTDAFGYTYAVAGDGTVTKTGPNGARIVVAEIGAYSTNLVVDAPGNIYTINAGTDELSPHMYKTNADGKTTVQLFQQHKEVFNFAMDFAGNIFYQWMDYAFDQNGEYSYYHAGTTLYRTDGTSEDLPQNFSASTYNLYLDTLGRIYCGDHGTMHSRITPIGGYFLNKILPAGLGFNSTTGVISGTPLQARSADNYVVTGYSADGSGQATVNIKVLSAQLSSLAVSTGILRPAFSPYVTIYQAPVGVSTVNVTASVEGSLATLKINGVITTSGTPSANISLNPGDNAVAVSVTPQNGGEPLVYNINVQRQSPPALSYSSPQTYVINKPISSLSPSYSQVSPYGYVGAGTVLATGLFPDKIASDGQGNVYISNTSDGTIKKIPAGGGSPFTIAIGFNSTQGLAADEAGNVYVSDYNNNSLSKIPAGGGEPVSIGSGFSYPTNITLDRYGNIYVLNRGPNNAYYINKTLATNGNTQVVSNLQFGGGDICIDVFGNIYYTENRSITKIPANGGPLVTTSSDDLATTYRISCDDWGNVYANTTDSLLLKVVPGTTSLQKIKLNQKYITDLQVSNSGLIYITDATKGTVKALLPDGGFFVKEHLPEGLLFDNNTGTISGTPTALSAPKNYTMIGYNAAGATTAALNIAVVQPDSTGLSNLAISSGTLNPAFVQTQTNYTVSVPNSTTSVMLTPVSTVSGATITVNGQPVSSGSISQVISLNEGSNVISLLVTAPGGTKNKTYTVNVVRASSTPANANLFNIALSTGTLNPSFSASTATYTASVGSGVSSITLIPITSAAAATVTVNGVTVSSGSASGNIPLATGTNLITTRVTSQDGTVKTYKITVTRALSSEASLAGLTLSSGTLSPVFATATTSYTATVGNDVSTITLTPSAAQPGSVITVNSTTVASGTASAPLPLNVGQNGMIINVTSPDGTTTKAYSLAVSRAPSSEAKLTALAVSSGTLTPAFAPGTTTYSVSVANAVSLFNVTPTASQAGAVIKVNGTSVASGSASPYMPLVVGNNPIQVVVTAPDGATTNTYTVNVSRPVSANANLAGIGISSGSLSPAFASGTTVYADAVNSATRFVTITPTVSEANATVTVNGVAVPSGTASAAINTPSNATTLVTIKVTAQDGTTVKTYKVNVVRPAASNDANLANFTVSNGTIAPAFSPATTSYATTVTNAISLYQVTPTVNYPTATVTINGMAVTSGSQSQVIPLIVGDNTITTVVTAEDGTTLRTYTLVVTRQVSTNANLANLSISGGTLSPAFAAATVAYTSTVSIATITVTPTVSEANATVTVNGTTVPSGTASGPLSLAVGSNVITVKVTAQNGTTVKTYKITVTRIIDTNNYLSNLSLSTGSYSPAFTSTGTSYTQSLPYTTASTTLTVQPLSYGASIMVNGQSIPFTTQLQGGQQVKVYAQNYPLAFGVNTFNILVTAESGDTRTITVTINRANPPVSNNANLGNILLSSGTLNPAISSTSSSYSVWLAYPYNSSTIEVTPLAANQYASVTFNGTPLPYGQSVSLPVSANKSGLATIKVLATDGVSIKTYTLSVSVETPSNLANLASLSISEGTLSPAFGSTNVAYTVSVANSVTSINVAAATLQNKATITVNGGTAVTHTTSSNVNLNIGTNLITIKVTAQDGTTVKTYKITVTRAAGASGFGNNTSISYANTESYTPDGNDVTVQQAMSPNGDGLNDRLQIDGIESHPDNKLTIIDRNGTLVYEIAGYDNNGKVFDGHSNKTGKLQIPGTYYYVLDYKTVDETKHKTGYLIIKY